MEINLSFDFLIEKILKLFQKKEKIDTSLLRDFICYHQGEIIQYFFIASELHKELKETLRLKNYDKKIIIEKIEKLKTFLNSKFETVSIWSFDKIKQFFKGRDKTLPRICLKANYQPEKNLITPLFRDENVGYNSTCNIEENTGFKYIVNNGKYFIENNIPKAIKDKRYRNPRIDIDKIKNYNYIKNFITSLFTKYDKEWVSCWKKINNIEPDWMSCYKSTLIIPLTLFNNPLSYEFKKKFRLKEVKRIIFGYLCFDHVKINYFNEDIDKDLGYIFADILSLYLLVRAIFITQSTTYKNAYDFIKNNS